MIHRSITGILFVLILSLHLKAGAAVASEGRSDSGLPFYSVYSLDTLGRSSISVVFSQDKSGRLMCIDGGMLMVFDGNTWSAKSPDEASDADSVASAMVGSDGVFYAGAVGRWGRLDMLPGGNFFFKAFPHDTAPEWTTAAHFDQILSTDVGVFFLSTLGVVQQATDGKTCHYWNNILPPQLVFEYNGNVYLSTGSGGLYRLKNWKWELVSGTERFGGSDAMIKKALCADGRLILASSSGKLYSFDGSILKPWNTDADPVIKAGIVDMVSLPSSEIAIAVRGYGVIVVDANGRVKMRIGYEHDDSFAGIRGNYQQEHGVLWAALSNGVAKIYYPSQVTFYDYRFGIPMHWPEVYHFKDSIVVFSDYRIFLGAYDTSGCVSKFEEINISNGDLVESCLGVGDQILFGSSGSIFCYDGTGAPTRIVSGLSSARMRAVRGRPDYVVAFGSDKHALLHRVGNKWTVVQNIPSMGFPATVLQTKSGDMWVEHGLGRVCLVREVEGRLVSTGYDKIEGMASEWVNVWELNGQIYFSSGQVIKRFEESTGKIVSAPEMKDLIDMIGGKVSRVFEAPDGTIWASGLNGIVLVRTVDGRTVVDRETLRPVNEAHALIQFDGDNVVWMLSSSRVIRYDASGRPPQYRTVKPFVSLATATNGRTGDMHIVNLGSDPLHPMVLPYETNNLLLRLFPDTYSLPSPPSYRYRIDGLNDNWTQPSSDTLLSFANLHEGDYKLEVEVLDHGIPIGQVSTYAFKIEPPWSRTWWAFLSYCLFALAVILAIVRISQRHSERERKRLERLVLMRTRELDETNTRLRESIKSAMAAAEAKSRFLANMSHEIRTPMNGVVGTTELLARTPLTGEQRELVEIINKSGSLLLSIVNDVLDYSKIEADQLVFELIPLRPQSLLEDVLEILGEKANEKKVEFFGSVEADVPFELIGDTTRVQQVLVNLCSNALKFTDHGEVEIKCWASERQDGRWDLFFSVRDTGIGMDPKRMNRLFKAFSQLDASNTRVYGGTGLGLAISKRLVERMGGAMDVTSEQGKGSCFTLSIPLPVSDRVAAPEEAFAGHPKDLLLVDDCAARRSLIARFLGRNGYVVSEMGSAVAVGAIAQGRKFDAVVVDCALDSDSWRDVADAASTHLKLVPMIVYRLPLQSVEHPAIMRRLTKPWRCNRLLSELRGCLDAHVEKPIEQSSAAGDAEHNIAASSLHILLAEDNAVNQRVAVLLLSRLGLKTDLANNGQEAVDMVKSHDYDIVLMDVQMPVMDGIQATLTIRNGLSREDQPIIVALTAGAMSSDREAAFSAGVDAYLTKPLRLETLRDQINDLIERVRIRRAGAKA
jgi:signal transduction histidine kinase/CheY-like chemotaxis protein